MKLLLLSLPIVIATKHNDKDYSHNLSPSFASHCTKYSLSFDDAAEALRRQTIYNENLDLISSHNADFADGASYAPNKYAHLSTKEFVSTFLLPSRDFSSSFSSTPSSSGGGGGPDSLDWREEGAVTEVKDQGTLGTCWIFSTIGNLEGQRFLHGDGTLESLSVENVLECDATMDDDNAEIADCGVFGGWPYLAFEGIISRGGLFSDSQMPYCAGVPYQREGNCMPCMPSGYSRESCGDHSDDDGGIPLYCNASSTQGQGSQNLCAGETYKMKYAFSIQSWTDYSSSSADEITSSLSKVGPLSVALDASRLQFYKSGVFSPSRCSSSDLNHAVLLVGYDNESMTIKNSWGPDWGEDGYFRIAKVDGAGTCGINTQVTSGHL